MADFIPVSTVGLALLRVGDEITIANRPEVPSRYLAEKTISKKTSISLEEIRKEILARDPSADMAFITRNGNNVEVFGKSKTLMLPDERIKTDSRNKTMEVLRVRFQRLEFTDNGF